MKTFVIDGNHTTGASRPAPDPDFPVAWYFIPDSAIANAGKPFFIPEFASAIEAVPVVALRIDRLGKTIAPRFASRYFSEMAVGVHFRAPLLRKTLAEKGLPQDMAYSFDRSLILSPLMPKEKLLEGDSVRMLADGEEVAGWDADRLLSPIPEVLKEVSAANTLKMGDLVVPSAPAGHAVGIGSIIEIMLAQECLLRVEIK